MKLMLAFSVIISILIMLGCIQPTKTCNRPYILVGDNCCLDENGDSICDKDKPVQKQLTTTIPRITTTTMDMIELAARSIKTIHKTTTTMPLCVEIDHDFQAGFYDVDNEIWFGNWYVWHALSQGDDDKSWGYRIENHEDVSGDFTIYLHLGLTNSEMEKRKVYKKVNIGANNHYNGVFSELSFKSDYSPNTDFTGAKFRFSVEPPKKKECQ